MAYFGVAEMSSIEDIGSSIEGIFVNWFFVVNFLVS